MLDSIYHDIVITLKIALLPENVKMLASFAQCKKGRHYVTLLNL